MRKGNTYIVLSICVLYVCLLVVNMTSWEPAGGRLISLYLVTYLYTPPSICDCEISAVTLSSVLVLINVRLSKMEHWTFNNNLPLRERFHDHYDVLVEKYVRKDGYLRSRKWHIFQRKYPPEGKKGKKMPWSQWQITAF